MIDRMRGSEAFGFRRLRRMSMAAIQIGWREVRRMPFSRHRVLARRSAVVLAVRRLEPEIVPMRLIGSVRTRCGGGLVKFEGRSEPNQQLEPTSLAVTIRADAPLAPARAVAHL
jgi:hypothetical protein